MVYSDGNAIRQRRMSRNTSVMSSFTIIDSSDINTELTHINRILRNELGEFEPITNSEAQEKIVELYKRIRFILIYFYKIRIRNKNIIVSMNTRETL